MAWGIEPPTFRLGVRLRKKVRHPNRSTVSILYTQGTIHASIIGKAIPTLCIYLISNAVSTTFSIGVATLYFEVSASLDKYEIQLFTLWEVSALLHFGETCLRKIHRTETSWEKSNMFTITSLEAYMLQIYMWCIMYYASIKAGSGILVTIFYYVIIIASRPCDSDTTIGPNCHYRARPPSLAPDISFF